MATRLVMSWSGGKDSAVALWRLQQDPAWSVEGLLTTVSEAYGRISMHGVRESLLQAQARALGLRLHAVRLPAPCSNADYEARMGATVGALLAGGVEAFGFGDLFLADIRAYRERQFAEAGGRPVFPIWGADTGALARDMVAAGFRATLCCVDPRQLDPGFAGRGYDAALLADLPPGVDPCGERGEFHTFVHGGPNFRQPVPVRTGETVQRDGFVYTDLLPADDGAGAREAAP